MKNHIKASSVIAMFAFLACTAVMAGPLSGSGTHLPIPVPNPGVPAIAAPAITFVPPDPNNYTGFNGTWTDPAQPAWQGTFTATGPLTDNKSKGTTSYDFTHLPTGGLPTGTYFFFGDVDSGSGTDERFLLTAYTALGGLIDSAWLDVPSSVYGVSAIVRDAMPAWSLVGGTYTIDGSNVSGNPEIIFVLPTNQEIYKLTVEKLSTSNAMGIYAPVPEPGTLWLFSLGLFVMGKLTARCQHGKRF